MIKEKLSGKYSVTLHDIEMHTIVHSEKSCAEATLNYRDEVDWNAYAKFLRVEFKRTIKFEPQAFFTITVSYYVDHELKDADALKNIDAQVLKDEICSDLSYYLKEKEGFLARISQLIANLTSGFGGVPVILPPVLPSQKDLH